MVDINDFEHIKECTYKGEKYSVRDNGAIMRHLRLDKKPRKNDGIWTFGVKNLQSGYMLHGRHRVHIIVATAFHGEHDTKIYVVDHKDTNRCNNRADNLRWFTRLENALNNEITRNKIIWICGSLEAFIENPNILKEKIIGEPSLEWMRAVTREEAKTAYKNIKRYWEEQAKNPKPLVGEKLNESVYNKQKAPIQSFKHNKKEKEDIVTQKHSQESTYIVSSKEWEQMTMSLRKPHTEFERQKDNDNIDLYFKEEFELVQAKSPKTAWQKKWKTPSEFLCCPTEISSTPIRDYYNLLVIGNIYNKTHYYWNNETTIQLIEDKALVDNNKAILVLSKSENSLKPYALSKIYFSENNFIHESLGTFFHKNGGRKYFILEQGLEWTGGEVFDDFC